MTVPNHFEVCKSGSVDEVLSQYGEAITNHQGNDAVVRDLLGQAFSCIERREDEVLQMIVTGQGQGAYTHVAVDEVSRFAESGTERDLAAVAYEAVIQGFVDYKNSAQGLETQQLLTDYLKARLYYHLGCQATAPENVVMATEAQRQAGNLELQELTAVLMRVLNTQNRERVVVLAEKLLTEFGPIQASTLSRLLLNELEAGENNCFVLEEKARGLWRLL